MRKIIAGILWGGTVLSLPVNVAAYERQCPQTIEVTQSEAQELMQIVWCEAGNQGITGQLLVMSVILNRVASPDFPDDVHSVIHQDHQFATSGMNKAEITPETHYALAELEAGNKYPEIVAFETTNNDALDVYFSEAFTYKDHCFYTSKQ